MGEQHLPVQLKCLGIRFACRNEWLGCSLHAFFSGRPRENRWRRRPWSVSLLHKLLDHLPQRTSVPAAPRTMHARGVAIPCACRQAGIRHPTSQPGKTEDRTGGLVAPCLRADLCLTYAQLARFWSAIWQIQTPRAAPEHGAGRNLPSPSLPACGNFSRLSTGPCAIVGWPCRKRDGTL